ncbi:hypothetical protein XQ44_20250 [Salmonella enterica]|nr:hypothetical protein [Salmonella enterica]EBP1427341.1 hypothetical protein [Salmonella enterica]
MSELKIIPENLSVIKKEILLCIDEYIDKEKKESTNYTSIYDEEPKLSYDDFIWWFCCSPIGIAASKKIDHFIQQTSLPIRKRILNEGMGFCS